MGVNIDDGCRNTVSVEKSEGLAVGVGRYWFAGTCGVLVLIWWALWMGYISRIVSWLSQIL
ncbi:hypothetical protein BDW74DRAFT_143520 [Aspergillus multicolor]|uniref:uncharacterized protein n=1 Tax=Aspergillus multicolor TaxID=41759 RepID=UPI003CCC9780